MVLKNDWVDGGPPSSANTYTATAANAVAAQVNTNTTKLSGIATGATANDTNADLRDRATHTGTQPSSSISGFTEDVQDVVGAMVVAGTNVTKSYNDAAGTLTINASPTSGYFYVDDHSSDPTGATFSDTAVAAAITAMGNNPGILVFGPGTYKLNSTKTLSHPGQGINGAGLGLTTIDYRGTGDCFRVWDSTVPTNGLTLPGSAGPIWGFKLIGWSNANTNICGLHIGDLGNIDIGNVAIYGFQTSGSKCFWGENRYSWSERANIQIETGWAPDNYLFETNASHPLSKSSWSYSTFNLAVSADPSQNGLTLKKNVGMIGVDLTLFGNAFGHATTNTGVVVTIGTTGTDTSIIEGKVTVAVESIGNPTVGHKDINIGAAALLQGTGALIFNAYEAAFVAGTATPSTAQFAGRINCPSLGASLFRESFRAAGGARLKSTPSAVNYPVIEAAVTGGWPAITAAGTDTDIGILLNPQGAAPVRQYVNTQTSAVWSVNGTQTNIDQNITTKGTGKVQANGVEVTTISGTQTQTNKTLTNPKVNSVKDTNGNTVLDLGATASAVNYVYAANSATGVSPVVGSGGSDTDVDLRLLAQGTGLVRANGQPVVRRVTVPASAGAAGSAGDIAYDSSFFYICVATSTWRRVATASW